jgi:hypothetical protein
METVERPCIHVSLLAGADPSLYHWVEIGAEEEGVPARLAPCEAEDLETLAYRAAQSSRLSIGVGISDRAVALHEQHMPVPQPVLVFKFGENAPFLCRRMGANAARMVLHRPLYIEVDHQPAMGSSRPAARTVTQAGEAVLRPGKPDFDPGEPDFDPAQLAWIAAIVVRKLQERGL